ncbi:MAG TPA: DsbA family protein [Candidatus Binataceae bacterium]
MRRVYLTAQFVQTLDKVVGDYEQMRDPLEIKFYFAYTSPFSYLAYEPAYALEQRYQVRIRPIPFGVNIRKTYGDTATRSRRDQNKVRYLYLDARRYGAQRGLTILPPKKIYSARLAFYAGLFADRHLLFRQYSERLFERFWKREIEVEELGSIAALLSEIGLNGAEFLEYRDNNARTDLDRCFAEADRDAIFGVPTLVVEGEPFWGHDRLSWVEAKLERIGRRR